MRSSAMASAGNRHTTSATTGSGYGVGCVGDVERRSPSSLIGLHRTVITAFDAANKPGKRDVTAPAAGNNQFPTRKIPLDCQTRPRCDVGPLGGCSVYAVP